MTLELFKPEDLDARELRLSLRYSVELELVYANNPKCACSTVKASMLKKIDDLNSGATEFARKVHSQEAYARLSEITEPNSIGRFRDATAFSVVRNPYKRAVSAYLDKVGADRKDQRIWNWTHRRYGLRSELVSAEFSFKDFLRLIASDDARAVDPHFRPQVYNLLWGHMHWNKVARLENKLELNDLLSARGMEVQRVDHHKTGSADVASDYLDEEAVELIKKLYAPDFSAFGYSPDPHSSEPHSNVVYAPSDDCVYAALSRERNFKAKDSDAPLAKFRKAAKIGEKISVVSSELPLVTDYNTALVFQHFIETMIAKEKTATITMDDLRGLQSALKERVRDSRAVQFEHIGTHFFHSSPT